MKHNEEYYIDKILAEKGLHPTEKARFFVQNNFQDLIQYLKNKDKDKNESVKDEGENIEEMKELLDKLKDINGEKYEKRK